MQASTPANTWNRKALLCSFETSQTQILLPALVLLLDIAFFSAGTAIVLLADSLLLGAGLAGLGTNRLMNVDWSERTSPAAGYAVAPAMVAAAIAARYLPVTGNDLGL